MTQAAGRTDSAWQGAARNDFEVGVGGNGEQLADGVFEDCGIAIANQGQGDRNHLLDSHAKAFETAGISPVS